MENTVKIECHFKKSILTDDEGITKIASYVIEDIELLPETVKKENRESKYNIAKGTFVVKGDALPTAEKVRITLEGHWEYDNKRRSTSFISDTATVSEPTTDEEMVAFLYSLVKGVGVKTIQAVVNTFHLDTLTAIQGDVEALYSQVKGLSEKKALKLIDAVEQVFLIQRLEEKLRPTKISKSLVVKIYKKYLQDSLTVVDKSPYKICDDEIVTFENADKIALCLGGNPQDISRIRAALKAACNCLTRQDGDVCVREPAIIEQAYKYINNNFEKEILSKVRTANALNYFVNEKDFKKENFEDETYIYLERDYIVESTLAHSVANLLERKNFDNSKPFKEAFGKWQAGHKEFRLAEKQVEAISLLNSPFSIITGGPGTGKTSVLEIILDVYVNSGRYTREQVQLFAPTSRAARRMSEKTGFPAYTLHKGLQLKAGSTEDLLNSIPTSLENGLVVVDEFSMVDTYIAKLLFDAIPATGDFRMIFIGDPDQLPSVGIGNVLKDLIKSEVVPTVKLESIFRQSGDSPIVTNAININNGVTNLKMTDDFKFYGINSSSREEEDERACEIVLDQYIESIKKFSIDETMLLCPKRIKGLVAANNLNIRIQERINPQRENVLQSKSHGFYFRPNDRVVQMKNTDIISNGDVGIVESVYKDESGHLMTRIKFDEAVVDYGSQEMQHVDLGYALTIHKSQGCEFQSVIIPLVMDQTVMLKRNLFYTAVTRAKKSVKIVGSKEAVKKAILTNDLKKRNTLLAKMVVDFFRQNEKMIA